MPPITPQSFAPNEDDENPFGGSAQPAVPQTAANLGGPMYPWLTPYGGRRTATMSPWENEALGGYQQFAQGGFGLNPARNAAGGYEQWLRGGMGLGQGRDYANRVLGGEFLDPSSNRWLAQIEQGAQGRKNIADQEAMRRIGSSMAAAGHGLSGARLGAEGDYMARSDAAYNEDIGRLMSENYGRERALQQGVLPYLMEMGAMEGRGYGDLASMYGNIAGQEARGWGQYMDMGGVPRSIEQGEYDRQYQDFLRQTDALRDQFRYPDEQMMNIISRGGYPRERPREYGDSTMEQILGMLGMTGAFSPGGKGGQGQGWANQLMQTGGNALVNAIKGLLGPNAGEQDVASFLQQAEDYGMTPEDLQGMVDYGGYGDFGSMYGGSDYIPGTEWGGFNEVGDIFGGQDWWNMDPNAWQGQEFGIDDWNFGQTDFGLGNNFDWGA